MYKISPSDANTELYQTGRNESQVLDFGTAERAIQYGLKERESQRAAKAKELKDARTRTSKLMNNSIGIVHPSDLTHFQQLQNDYRNNVLKAYQKGGGQLSVEDEAGLNQQFANMNQLALQSEARHKVDTTNLATLNNPNNAYRDREHQKVHDAYAKSSYNPETGTYDFSNTSPTAQFDIEKDIVSPLSSKILSQAENNDIYGKSGIPINVSASHAASIVRNPLAARELHEQVLDLEHDGKFDTLVSSLYGSPTDEFGNKNTSYIADEKEREKAIKSTTPENINLEDVAKYVYTNRFVHKHIGNPPSQFNIGVGSAAYKNTPALTNTITSDNNDSVEGEYTLDKSNVDSDKVYQNIVIKKNGKGEDITPFNAKVALDKVRYKINKNTGETEIKSATVIEQLPPEKIDAIKKKNDTKAELLDKEQEKYDRYLRANLAGKATDEQIATFNQLKNKYGGRPSEKNIEFKPAKYTSIHTIGGDEAYTFANNHYLVDLKKDIKSQTHYAEYDKTKEGAKSSNQESSQNGTSKTLEALTAFEQQFKRKPTDAERAKIIQKYR